MPDKIKVARFSVSLPSKQVEDINKVWRNMGYKSRSKAIHDALQNFISEFEWMNREKGLITGAILVLHYLDKPGILDTVTGIQHKHENIIPSSMHIHIGENKCLEIIAVKGSVHEVKKLAKDLMIRKGVKQVKTAFLTP
jgi:CopG family nickel-responsive transcriptional regulator